MSAHYDTAEWAAETTLGRRVFNANFRMTGNELPGWQLVNSASTEHESGVIERIYVWRKSGARRETLIRAGIVELDSWRAAQQHQLITLLNCMRPDIPRAKGALAATGDISFAASERKSKALASVFFTRGNVLVSLASVGDTAVDVSALAKKLDASLREPPKKGELTKGLAEQRSPRSFDVKKTQPIAVIDGLSRVVATGARVKVIAPDGELRREDDRLIYLPEGKGRKRVGQYIYT